MQESSRVHGRVHPSVLGARCGGRDRTLSRPFSRSGKASRSTAGSRSRARSLAAMIDAYAEAVSRSGNESRSMSANSASMPSSTVRWNALDVQGEVLRDTRTTYHLLGRPTAGVFVHEPFLGSRRVVAGASHHRVFGVWRACLACDGGRDLTSPLTEERRKLRQLLPASSATRGSSNTDETRPKLPDGSTRKRKVSGLSGRKRHRLGELWKTA